jgi:long-chain acyl-CoA synthetase
MRDHLATLLDDFRRFDREIAVVRYQGNRRRVSTYGEIAHLAGRFAALLESRAIGMGDRVLLWAENSAEWIAAFHGCMLRGVLAVPLDAYGTAEFAARVAADVSPKLVVGDAVLLDKMRAWPQLSFEDWLAQLPAEEAGPVTGISADTPLQILFTSGTTGDPKGIVLTHGNVLASIGPIEKASQPYLRYVRLIHPLRILHTLPLSHVFGQTMGLWVPPIYAAELHFESRLVASRLVETIRRERISVLAAVPRVLALLKTHLESTLPGLAERAAGPKGTATGVSVLRRWARFRDVHAALGLKFWAIISGGGALAGPLEKFWNAVGLVVVQGYGMTETTALITLNHPFHVAQGTIGKPLAGREVKLGPDGEVLVRGAAISSATWSGGALQPRANEWLSTGDLAESEPSGELRFLGRKSEVIVTAAGLNLHPEDLETAVEQQRGVAACAVVPMETAAGPEPCAVLAFRGNGEQASAVMEQANARLAEFQRMSRWVIWPEPDLPRTSTGKVRRKAVAEWLGTVHAASTNGNGGAHKNGTNGHKSNGNGANGNGANGNGSNGHSSNGQSSNGHSSNGHATHTLGASTDWLLTMIAQVSGESPAGVGDKLRITEDLHLDSLGRVQLAAAIEERTGIALEARNGSFDHAQTLGDLRLLLDSEPMNEHGPHAVNGFKAATTSQTSGSEESLQPASEPSHTPELTAQPSKRTADNLYPHWPWWSPIHWARVAFLELVLRPLVWLLANPRVNVDAAQKLEAPMLIVANHVTAFDGPLLEYALPGPIRRRMAVAMSGEMLTAYRRFRNLQPARPTGRFFLPGPLYYFLVTALFNVFPLPRQRDFQRSFAHAGQALDAGFNVMVFPEGARSAEGHMAKFRPGIGMLVKQSRVPVLPMAMRGLGDLKARGSGWFRSGKIEVRVGQPIRFGPLDSEPAITARLQEEVGKLLEDRE